MASKLSLIDACWPNTNVYSKMSGFSDFHSSVMELRKKFEEKGLQLRIEKDAESPIIKIYGSDFSQLDRAKNGIEDALELSFTTAEHHPYWAILYNSSQIIKTTLDKWNSNLSKDDLDELQWSIKELEHTCKRLKENLKTE